ncbi:MAG: hypothetical protein ABIK89_19295, partial [Planctomycetota bacterium]
MKTTARILTGLFLIALGFSEAPSFADQWSTGATSFGASGGTPPYGAAEARRRSDDLLERGR